MTRLNVRCCCQPQKILGTLEVRDVLAEHGGSFQVLVSNTNGLLSRDDRECLLPEVPAVEIVTCEIRKISVSADMLPDGSIGRNYERAVYSDDRPIEFWRKIPGFVEA